ncbi:TPA: host cell division inhibitor Icd-like protein [Escherichia coli]|nr:host cell division inhibitor Icd-like protein [Escherichia coli]
MNTGYTPVQGRGFVRPEKQNLQNFAVISGLIGGSETNIVNARALQMFDDEKGVNLTYPPDGNQNMSIISESVFYKLIKTKSAPLPERPCEQLTCCEKNGSVQGNYINRVAKRHNCRITGKTKATRYGGPSTLIARYPQRKRADYYAVITSGWQCDQCAGLLVGYSYSLALRRWSSSRATATSCPISSAALTPIFSTCASASSEETRGFSPLPSAWRRAISPRTAVITKAAIVSPSVFEFSISSITSWGKRIFFICDLLLMFPVAIRMSGYFEVCTHYTKRCVNKTLDTVAHLNLICMYTNNCGVYTATPRSGGTHAGRLTTNDRKSIEVAMRNHTTHPQGRDSHDLNKYIWRFIALSTAQPRVITIEATSEQEARQQSPAGCVMVFAARIRQGVRHVQ